MKEGFSIILCTYNGLNRLKETLTHILELKIPSDLNAELIFVDNRSSDKTSEYFNEFFKAYDGNLSIRYFYESRPGKAYAFEHALNKANFSFGLICDDDNWLDPNYLINSKLIFDEFPEVGILGGKSIGEYEGPLPHWFAKVKKAFAIGVQAEMDGILDDKKEILWGAGMVFRMEIWKKLQSIGFSFITGTGVNKAVGEDAEFSIISKILGYELYFSEKLLFKHFMPIERLKWSVAINYYKGFGLIGPYFSIYKKILKNRGALSFFQLEKEVLKITFLSFVKVISLFMKKTKTEGDINVLLYVQQINYFKEILSIFGFRKKLYFQNYQMRKLGKYYKNDLII